MRLSDPQHLRQRKKAETRERIHKVGLQLFNRQGFAETTIAQIAAEADVAPRTVFQHYPTKDDIVFGDVEGALQAFDAGLKSRPPGVTAIDAVRAWLDQVAVGWLEPDTEVQVRLVAEVPSVAARKTQILDRFREPLTAAIATDLDRPTDDLAVQLSGWVAIGGLLQIEALVSDRIRMDGTMPSTSQIDAVLRQVERFIRSGVGAVDHERP